MDMEPLAARVAFLHTDIGADRYNSRGCRGDTRCTSRSSSLVQGTKTPKSAGAAIRVHIELWIRNGAKGGAGTCLVKDMGLRCCHRRYEGWIPGIGTLFRDVEGDSAMGGSFEPLECISDVSA